LDRPLIRKLLVVATLAGVVAVGSAGDSTWATLRFGRPDPVALALVLTAAMVLGIAGAWAAATLLHRRALDSEGGSIGTPGRSVDTRRVVPWAVVAVALLGLLGISRLDLGTPRPGPAAQDERGPGLEGRPLNFWDTRSPPVRATEAEHSSVGLLDRRPVPMAAALLVLVVGGAVLAWWWVGKRRRQAAQELFESIDTEAARHTVLRSIEAMLADPDPDTAVIGAYARLLEGLAASGVPRLDFEGPVEHLGRALTHLRVRPGPVRRLVALFQVARFSTRALTLDDRDEALAALRLVAADLGHDGAGPSASAVSLSGEDAS
jgi:hypothetical protein